jgi:predicted nucleic-acid-binding Zn-ribbon protein
LEKINSNEWKCTKCGSREFRKKHLKLRGSLGTTGFLDAEEVTAYFCNECGYIEFYERRD